MNGDDIGMQNGRCGFGFASESLASRTAAGQMRRHDFDGHNPIERTIVSFQYHAHATSTNHTDNFIATDATERFWIVGWS